MPRFLRQNNADDRQEGFRNIDDLIGTIIAHKRATFHELKTIYDLEDAMVLWETIVIPQYNQRMADERASKNR